MSIFSLHLLIIYKKISLVKLKEIVYNKFADIIKELSMSILFRFHGGGAPA